MSKIRIWLNIITVSYNFKKYSSQSYLKIYIVVLTKIRIKVAYLFIGVYFHQLKLEKEIGQTPNTP